MAYSSVEEFYGIDFGTTNISIVRYLKDTISSRVRIEHLGEENAPIPSILALKKDGDQFLVECGIEVKTNIDKLEKEGYTIIKSIKSQLGKNDNGEISMINVDGEKLYPIDIVKMLVEGAIKRTSLVDVKKINDINIAVPVSFNKDQREDIAKAISNLNINVQNIISEPVAAYLSNRLAVDKYSRVMVFDWGGGTLDISIIENQNNAIRELSTNGVSIAGDFIDNALAEYMHNKLVMEYEDTDTPIAKNYREVSKRDRLRLIELCEEVKKQFSNEDNIYTPKFIKMLTYCGAKSINARVTYDEFCGVVDPIIKKALEVIDDTLDKSNMSPQDINAIIVVGGTSKLLKLRQALNEVGQKYNIKIVCPEQPQYSIAEGATIMGMVNSPCKIGQNVNILLSDETLLPIISEGQEVNTKSKQTTFSLVEESTNANFIFMDDNRNEICHIILPCKGFLGENFMVEGRIRKSLIGELVVTKMQYGEKIEEITKEIGKLSYYYDLGDIGQYKYEC